MRAVHLSESLRNPTTTPYLQSAGSITSLEISRKSSKPKRPRLLAMLSGELFRSNMLPLSLKLPEATLGCKAPRSPTLSQWQRRKKSQPAAIAPETPSQLVSRQRHLLQRSLRAQIQMPLHFLRRWLRHLKMHGQPLVVPWVRSMRAVSRRAVPMGSL